MCGSRPSHVHIKSEEEAAFDGDEEEEEEEDKKAEAWWKTKPSFAATGTRAAASRGMRNHTPAPRRCWSACQAVKEADRRASNRAGEAARLLLLSSVVARSRSSVITTPR